jgi:DNA-binding beta-propeller fold protein YncE
VTPISLATNRPGKPVRFGRHKVFPTAIAATPDGKTVYVASVAVPGRPGTVTPIATAANTPGKPIRVGGGLQAIAITPDGKTVYVVSGGGTVTPIATATNTPGKPIEVGPKPSLFAIAR